MKHGNTCLSLYIFFLFVLFCLSLYVMSEGDTLPFPLFIVHSLPKLSLVYVLKGTASIKMREIDPSHVKETSFTARW